MESVIKREQVLQAINTILSDKKHYKTTLNWAINYCKATLTMSEQELIVQIPYILNNIIYWRHPDAKEVRRILKDYIS